MSNHQDNINPDSPISISAKPQCPDNCLAKMCASFDSQENRQKFKDFPEAYCHNFDLSEEQIHAVTDLDIQRMLKVGGDINCIAKLTSIYELSVEDLCLQQTGKNLVEVMAEL